MLLEALLAHDSASTRIWRGSRYMYTCAYVRVCTCSLALPPSLPPSPSLSQKSKMRPRYLLCSLGSTCVGICCRALHFIFHFSFSAQEKQTTHAHIHTHANAHTRIHTPPWGEMLSRLRRCSQDGPQNPQTVSSLKAKH